MNKVMLVLQKEWVEIFQQRILLLAIFLLPVLLTVESVYLISHPEVGGVHGLPSPSLNSDPRFASLSQAALTQLGIGLQIRIIFFLLPMIIPTVIAAHSIVGEKANRTLEPLLAAPVSTIQLLAGKTLAAMIPAVIGTWISAGIFILATLVSARNPVIFSLLISPEWLFILIIAVPLMVLIPISITVMLSSRLNDMRSVQQIATIIGVVLGFGFVYLTIYISSGVVLGLVLTALIALLAVLSFWIATRFFKRESILTHWI